MFAKRWLSAVGICLLVTAAAWAAPPHKALIVDGQNAHDWKSTSPVLKKLLEDTGLFAVDVATSPPKGQDMSGFKPDFAAYDVVVSNYQGDAWPEATQKALEDYVSGGGGLLIFHFACAAFPDWKEYNEMMGLGGWGGRGADAGTYVRWRDGKFVHQKEPGPADVREGKGGTKRVIAGSHGPAQPFQLVVRNADHPITKGLPPAFMHCEDELYGWLRGPAKNLTVLATAFAPKDKGGSGEHEPLLFTVKYGKGRVVQNALGHTPEQMKSVAFITTYQRCAEWAATGKVTVPVPDDFPGPDKASIRE